LQEALPGADQGFSELSPVGSGVKVGDLSTDGPRDSACHLADDGSVARGESFQRCLVEAAVLPIRDLFMFLDHVFLNK
jgi:hypothetical protein